MITICAMDIISIVSCCNTRQLNGKLNMDKEKLSDVQELAANTGSLDTAVQNTLDRVIIYNRVPKCASTSTRLVFSDVSKLNKFHVHVSKIYTQEYMNTTRQGILINNITHMRKPLLYIRHMFFVDFTSFEQLQPMYINMIRDPLDRLVSDYYYKRYHLRKMFPMTDKKRKRTYNDCVQGNYSECLADGPQGYYRVIPYFCGQQKQCLQPSLWSLNQAKRHVEEYFQVVGLVEYVPEFLEVLEKIAPAYFKRAPEIYKLGGDKLKHMAQTSKKDPLEEKTIKIMKEKLVHDYDFYHFVKQRFQTQYKNLFHTDIADR